MCIYCLPGFSGGSVVKNLPAMQEICRRREFDSWIGKIPCSKKWQPTPVFLPGKSMDRGAWQAIVHGVGKSQTRLSAHTPILPKACAVLCFLIQLCTTLCNPTDHSSPGSSVHEVLQARILEWAVLPSSRGSSQHKDQTQVSRTAGRFFTDGLPGKPT